MMEHHLHGALVCPLGTDLLLSEKISKFGLFQNSIFPTNSGFGI